MNRFNQVMGCVALVVILLIGHSAFGQSEVNEEINAALENWCKVIMDADLEETVGCYDQSDSTMVFVSQGKIRKGSESIRDEYKDGFDEVTFDSVGLEDLEINHHGGVGWASCRLVATTTLKADRRKKYKIEVYSSFVLKKIANDWKIVLEHSSIIKDVPRVRPLDDD